MDQCPIQGESKTLIRLTLQKPEISARSMGHQARKGFGFFWLKQLEADKSKILKPSREETITLRLSSWKKMEVDYTVVFKQLFVTNADPSSLPRILRETHAFQFILTLTRITSHFSRMFESVLFYFCFSPKESANFTIDLSGCFPLLT